MRFEKNETCNLVFVRGIFMTQKIRVAFDSDTGAIIFNDVAKFPFLKYFNRMLLCVRKKNIFWLTRKRFAENQ